MSYGIKCIVLKFSDTEILNGVENILLKGVVHSTTKFDEIFIFKVLFFIEFY